MPDREKVLLALEHHKRTAVCNGCPYAGDKDTLEGYCPVYDDAIAMLREQKRASWILDRLHHYKCSACGAQWGRAALNMNYCPTCGQYMEGRDPDDWRYAQDAEPPEVP